MRNLAIILTAGLISLGANAQKVIEKNIDYKNQYIDIELKFASEIEVKTWDKASVYVKADISMEEEKYEDMFELNIDEGSSTIDIGTNSEKIFKKIWDDYEEKYGKKKRYFHRGDEYEFNYTVYLPKNSRFKVSSINGSLKSEVIEGDFTADLINGDIDIKAYKGNLDLSTINGAIDLKMINADLVAETIHGNIYADEKLKFDATDRHVGQKISGRTADGKNRLRLNTINGNMYLRL
ncbi:hypothetical protein ACEZ3G_04995 [Maribacter algicola]|uniref:Uncharacterized protein n=1 Tax=Meishania litoralis TaxID=3434685 RepID=A0ACC7LLI6_9FLAO